MGDLALFTKKSEFIQVPVEFFSDFLCCSYDLDYPIACDDEYWALPDPSKSFQQPPDKPSIVSYFNCSLRLMEILANVMRLLVSLVFRR